MIYPLSRTDVRTTTTETIDISSTGTMVVLNSSSAVAVTLDFSGASGGLHYFIYPAGDMFFCCYVLNLGAGTATLTPTSGLINGVASVALGTGLGGWLSNDGTNWNCSPLQGLTNPMTTKGDLVVGDTSGTPARLAAGTSGYVLTSNGSGNFPSYQSIGTIALPDWLKQAPDAPPSSAGTLDDEFTDANFNDNGKWTTLDYSLGGNATRTQGNSFFSMTHASNSTAEGVHAIVQSAPGTPWTVIAKLTILSLGSSSNHWSTGLCLRDSGTGKFQLFKVADGTSLTIDNYSNDHTYASTQFNLAAVPPPFVWFKIQDNGTNIVWSMSLEGAVYWQLTSFSRTTYLANPNQVGLFINPYQQAIILNCDYFRRTQ